jgi:hypothetical protein
VCPWNDANSCFVGRRPSMNSCRCVTAFRSLQRWRVGFSGAPLPFPT